MWSLALVASLALIRLPGISTAAVGQELKLTVLHTNDVHARIDEFDAKGSRCTAELSAQRKCYGGIARHRYIAEKLRSERPNATIFLNAGDYFQGTFWYYHLKASIIADTIELLQHDAITLGNHEFDDGSEGLLPLLERAQRVGTPVLACNVDFSKNDLLRQYQPQPSIIVERSGVKIGIIGYLTPETSFLSNVDGATVMTSDVDGIRQEAKKLNAQGVKIIIATGHSGYIRDMEIAKIPEVKLVVGAHSHTFLSSIPETNGDPVKGPYPTVISRSDGSKALVVQDFWMGKYMGYINVTFDTVTGDVKSWEGDSPILLDQTVPKDEAVSKFIESKREIVDEAGNKIVGVSLFPLSGDKEDCRFGECALADMIADSYMEFFASEYDKKSKTRWDYVDIATVNGGGIRGNLPKGNITFGDVVTVSPFANQIWILSMNGARVKKMMEAAVSKYDKTKLQSYGGFLHYSGARVRIDISKPVGSRVVNVEVICASCGDAGWEPLQPTKTYKVAMNSYIAGGGDNLDFSDIPASSIEKTVKTDTELIAWYIGKMSPIHPVIDRRLQIFDSQAKGASSLTTSANFALVGIALLFKLVALLFNF